MTQPRPTQVRSAEFSALFRMIVRATLASGCVAACSTETELDGGEADASLTPDGGVTNDGGGRDASVLPDGDGAVPPDAGGDSYAYLECETEGVLPELPAPISTTPGAESVAIYTRIENIDRVPELDPSFGLRASFGPALCAQDDADCAAELQNVLGAAPCTLEQASCTALALTKRGDQLTRIQTRAELLTFFGEIDSVAEAVLLAAFDAHTVHCAQTSSSASEPRTWKGTGVYQDGTGFHVESEYEICWAGATRERYTITPDGVLRDLTSEELAPASCVIGRRPTGVCGARPAPSRGETAGFLAEVAELEAASVLAFRQIEAELAQLGAPRALIAASRAALCDEVRHADVMSRLARRFGGTPQVPTVPASALRSAFELACDNASEGCVRETFGALLASHQAEHAEDAELRAALRVIAADETRHAQLSWEIAAWLEPRLSEAERAEVERVRVAAVDTLRGELDLGLSTRALRELGLPAEAVAVNMFEQLRETLWS